MLVPYQGESFEVVCLQLGPYDNFVYSIVDRATKKAAVIDPAWDVPAIEQALAERGAEITMILMTHTHPDHVNGVDETFSRHDVPMYIHEKEAKIWGKSFPAMRFVEDEEIIQLGETPIRVIETPGHTIGGLCFHMEGHIICGDSFFVYGMGHCRLPGSNPKELYATMKKIQQVIPLDTIMYPAHDYGITPTITLEEQIAGNPFFRCKDEADFVDYRVNRHKRSTPYEACEPA